MNGLCMFCHAPIANQATKVQYTYPQGQPPFAHPQYAQQAQQQYAPQQAHYAQYQQYASPQQYTPYTEHHTQPNQLAYNANHPLRSAEFAASLQAAQEQAAQQYANASHGWNGQYRQ